MNNKSIIKKIITLICSVLCFCVGITSCTEINNKKDEIGEITTPVVTESNDGTISKDETVYVFTRADGSVRKVIVSDWIKNALSELSPVNCSEIEYADTVKVSDLLGNDINYFGTIENELPIGMSITYMLDGKDVSAEEITGKSGKISIRFDYENRQYETMKINGKDEKIYVPFAVLTGMILNNETFCNVQVKNAKLINDGDHTAVVGIAFPSLQADLGISEDVIDIPDYLEITADVTDFKFGMTLTVATNRLFNGLDDNKLDFAGRLSDSAKELTDGFVRLVEGSSTLYDGVGQLKSGAGELANGLNMLKDNNAALNGGARQVFETLLSTAENQIKANGISITTLTVENYAQVLDDIIASLEETAVYDMALEQVRSAVEENRPLITEKVTDAVREQVKIQVTAVAQEQVSSKVIPLFRKLVMSSAKIKREIQTNTDEQMLTEDVQKIISDNVELQIEQIIQENMESEAVQSQLTAASEGFSSLISLKSSLDSYNEFYLGLQAYTDGVAAAAEGADKLSRGSAELENGAKQIYDGLERIYEEAIQKLINFTDVNNNSITARLKALISVSEAHGSFAGTGDDMDGQVFIYRTDEIFYMDKR